MELTSFFKDLFIFLMEHWKQILMLSIIFGIHFYYTSTFAFFEKKGIKYLKPTIFFGNFWERVISKKSFHNFDLDTCNYFRGDPYGGTFEGRRPILHLFDLELIKAVMIRDFNHFVDRNFYGFNDPKPSYLKQCLIYLKGSDWKDVRSTLTPAFSSARLKNMLPLIQTCCNELVNFLKERDKTDVEMKHAMSHYTLEVVGACAFGIKYALASNKAHFVKVAEKFDYMPKLKKIPFFFLLIFMPGLIKYCNFTFLYDPSINELLRILKAVKAERRSSRLRRNDFLQLLLEAADKKTEDKTKKHLDDESIDAQLLLFLIAGYETSSILISFAVHVLATKPDLQDKLRAHVEDLTKDKKIDHGLLTQLPYLEAFLLETLRIYPPVSRVDRVCTKDYTLPGTSVNIKVGDTVAIPIYGIHMNPDIYSDPEEFRPERFIGEEKKERPSHHFLAFGAGPRNCIGLRFSMFSAKLVMIYLLKNFKFSTCSKTADPITIDKGTMTLSAEGGVWVHVEFLKV